MKQVALSDLLTYLNSFLVNANAATSATSLATIAADGTAVTMSGYTFPSTDGTADQQLKTDGSGNLSFFTTAAQFTAGNAIEINSGQIDHEDTSSQASVNNSGSNFIQDITLDTYGHVTGITSAEAGIPIYGTTDAYPVGSVLLCGLRNSTQSVNTAGATSNGGRIEIAASKLGYVDFSAGTFTVSTTSGPSAGTWRTTNPVSLPGGGFQIGQKMALWQRIS